MARSSYGMSGFDIILGRDWLTCTKVLLNFYDDTPTVKFSPRGHAWVCAEELLHKTPFPRWYTWFMLGKPFGSAKVDLCFARRSLTFHGHLHASSHKIFNVLEDFLIVFLERPAESLHTDRNVNHTIPFQGGATQLGGMYRVSHAESKDIEYLSRSGWKNNSLNPDAPQLEPHCCLSRKRMGPCEGQLLPHIQHVNSQEQVPMFHRLTTF